MEVKKIEVEGVWVEGEGNRVEVEGREVHRKMLKAKLCGRGRCQENHKKEKRKQDTR